MAWAFRDGNSASASIASLVDSGSAHLNSITTDNQFRRTYCYSASFTPQATAAVTMISIVGAAGADTVRVKRFRVGGVSTANASVICQILRTTALGAGGTTVNPTAGLNDKNTAAAPTNLVAHYTTTLKATGTASGGPLKTHRLFTSVVTTPTVGLPMQDVWVPTGQSGVLRGVADFFEYQLVGGGNLSAGTVLEYEIEIEVDAS